MFKNVFLCVLVAIVFCLSSCQNGSKSSLYDGSNAVPGSQQDLDTSAGNFVLFKLSSAQLDDNATDTLKKQVDWLKRYRDINIIIEGHCDERGTREFNLALGARRANIVRDYFVNSGIDSSRITTISYGKERPPVIGSGLEVWRQNRRSNVMIR